MGLFQNAVLNKYLKTLESEKVNEAYLKFTNHFHNETIQENIRNSKEEQYQGEFLIDLFVNVLGYIKNPSPDFNLTTELKNVKGAKKTDGAIVTRDATRDATRDLSPLANTMTSPLAKAVIELKGTNTTDLSKVETQAFGYKNNQPGCHYVITSNFEKLRFYIDNAVDFEEFNLFQLTKERFDVLWLCLSSDYLLKDIPKKIKDQSLTLEENITKKLYKDYAAFRNEIFDNIQNENPDYDKLTLFKKTQKLLDRFLFIFFAEDRLLLPPNSIRSIVNQWTDLRDKYDEYFPLYDRFKKYFGYMNTGHKGQQHHIFAYNGGLFAPDDILDNIKINDDLLYKHTINLSNYDFESEVGVNILGHIFEHSLNDIDEIQTQLSTGFKSINKRKKDGVFYTPKYITKYIVDQTVGKLCEDKKTELDIQEADYEKERKGRQKATLKKLAQKLEDYRKWLLQITICDPACGSGAFLNQTLEFLIAEHSYIDELQAKLFGDAIILSEVENSILEHNIFGVDINEESVEIAKLSLWLRTAQKGRKLTSLNNNIKCGNSLIDNPSIAGDKAFNWQQQFPHVFKEKDKKIYHITTAIHDSRTSDRMVKYKVRLHRDMGTNPYPNVIYFTPEDDLLITKTIADIVEQDQLNLLAYNICADHLHLLLACNINDIPAIMQKIKGRTSYNKGQNKGLKSLGKQNKTKKPLWTQKYSAPKEVTSQTQLQNTLSYIQNNRKKHELPPHSKELEQIITTMCCPIEDAFTPEYKGGFDIIIGNPPYVLCQPSNTEENVLDFYKSFEVASYKIDLFHLFFEKSIHILKQNGKLGFITPNTYLNNKYIKPLRSFILKHTSINTVVNYKDSIFVDAGVDVATIILTKTKTEDNEIDLFEVENTIEKQLATKAQSLWEKDKEQLFNLNKEFEIRFEDCIPLGKIASVTFGLQTKDKKTFVSTIKKNNDWESCYTGKDVSRYFLENASLYFLNQPEEVKSGGSWNMDFHHSKKIVVRQVGNPEPIFAFDDFGYATLNTMYSIVLNPNYSYSYVLAILNSNLIKAFFLSKYSDGKQLFPKIKGFQLKELPIKIAAKDTQTPFIDIADQMLTLNKDLQKLTSKFQRTLQRKFPVGLEKLSKKMQVWYRLSYSDFVKELQKKKIKLNLSEEAEWEDYFLTEQQKAKALKAEINKTDQDIDLMVYKLYGLTEDEIKFVEHITS